MTEPEKNVLPHLGSDGRDRSTAVLRSIAGLGPNGLEARALWQLSRDKLESFNLLTFRQKTEKVGTSTAYPLLDNWGKRKGTHSISAFGERFLEVVELKEPSRRHRGGRTPSVDSDGSD